MEEPLTACRMRVVGPRVCWLGGTGIIPNWAPVLISNLMELDRSEMYDREPGSEPVAVTDWLLLFPHDVLCSCMETNIDRLLYQYAGDTNNRTC